MRSRNTSIIDSLVTLCLITAVIDFVGLAKKLQEIVPRLTEEQALLYANEIGDTPEYDEEGMLVIYDSKKIS